MARPTIKIRKNPHLIPSAVDLNEVHHLDARPIQTIFILAQRLSLTTSGISIAVASASHAAPWVSIEISVNGLTWPRCTHLEVEGTPQTLLLQCSSVSKADQRRKKEEDIHDKHNHRQGTLSCGRDPHTSLRCNVNSMHNHSLCLKCINASHLAAM